MVIIWLSSIACNISILNINVFHIPLIGIGIIIE